MKVHLCCGDVYLRDYQNVDAFGDLIELVHSNPNLTTIDNYYKKALYDYHRPVIDKRMNLNTEWDFAWNSIDEFLLICGIEHVSREISEQVIENVFKSLKPGGKFKFDFPDILKTVEKNLDKPEHMMRLVYGSGKNEFGFHKWGYTKESILRILERFEWKKIEFKEIIPHEYPMIGVEATK